ncbi:MAG: tRNA-dihydrouridine synthase [Proteobacteria bacterium]|nr:tRNA-dihydrouridine synthase [Pseudomonadota bacterium]
MSKPNPFVKLGLRPDPLLLAPLAGVSDNPFRRVCAKQGAELCYVEMISATAMLYESRRTYEMLRRHPEEGILGVQITGPSADEVGRAVAILQKMNFETIDINMGCPVKKVVKTGCGAAILRDPERIMQTVKAAVSETDKPISAKIRLGWDRQSMNGLELAQAAEAGGAAWVVVHGRTRADDYGVPVDLEGIRQIKAGLSIPVIGNGNLFQAEDLLHMKAMSSVDGFMISRGALGNPWLFKEIRQVNPQVSIDEWEATVLEHLAWQEEEYGEQASAAVCMRKHLLWYAKGWNGVKPFREKINQASSLKEAGFMVKAFAEQCRMNNFTQRISIVQAESANRFAWDPKFEMDRQLDRGIAHEDFAEVSLKSDRY